MNDRLFDDPLAGGAYINGDGLYRYRLWRRWAPGGQIMVWIMLNPSTADATTDDPTIGRCIGFAKREGCNAIEVINLYALRASKPIHLLDHPDPEGEDNERTWEQVLNLPHTTVVAAWGNAWTRLAGLPTTKALERFEVDEPSWWCLGHTGDAMPRHPLYLAADTPLIRHC